VTVHDFIYQVLRAKPAIMVISLIILSFFKACWSSSELLGMFTISIGHAPNPTAPHISYPLSLPQRSSPDMHTSGASSLMLLSMQGLGAAYTVIVRQTPGEVLGIGGAPEGRTQMRVGSIDPEEFFICVVYPFFVSMIVLQNEKGDMGGIAGARVEERRGAYGKRKVVVGFPFSRRIKHILQRMLKLPLLDLVLSAVQE